MLAHRLRRWPNIKPPSGQRLCNLPGNSTFSLTHAVYINVVQLRLVTRY